MNAAAGIAILTCNGLQEGLEATLRAVASQTLPFRTAIVLDTASTDGSPQLAAELGFTVIAVAPAEFNHGLTRQRALQLLSESGCTIAIFLTQDAELASPETLERLTEAFSDPTVAAAYARQLPRKDASYFERHSRQVNYPAMGAERRESDRERLGWRTLFCSNTCAAWRVEAAEAAGGFPETDFGEDMLLADRLLRAGFAIAYVPEAEVIHSHPATLRTLFQRGRAIGKFHHEHPELRNRYGKAEKNALVLFHGVPFCFSFLFCAFVKYLGYLFGRIFH